MTFDEFLKENKLEFKVAFKNSLKKRIDHTFSYIKYRHIELKEPGRYTNQSKASFNIDDFQQFIKDYIAYLKDQMTPFGKLPNDDDLKLLEGTILLLKRDYLTEEKHNNLFTNDTNEEFFKHCVNYLEKNGRLNKTSFVHLYYLFNNKFLKSQQKLYCEYVNKNYIKVINTPFKKVNSIRSLLDNTDATERRNIDFMKAQSEWNKTKKKQMHFKGLDTYR